MPSMKDQWWKALWTTADQNIVDGRRTIDDKPTVKLNFFISYVYIVLRSALQQREQFRMFMAFEMPVLLAEDDTAGPQDRALPR